MFTKDTIGCSSLGSSKPCTRTTLSIQRPPMSWSFTRRTFNCSSYTTIISFRSWKFPTREPMNSQLIINSSSLARRSAERSFEICADGTAGTTTRSTSAPIPRRSHGHSTTLLVGLGKVTSYSHALSLRLELSLPTKSTYAVEETTRGITVIDTFDADQPPTYQNQPPNADILDKVSDRRTCSTICTMKHGSSFSRI